MSISKNVILKLEEPVIQTYAHDAYTSSILQAHGQAHVEWLLSNYLQLCANKELGEENNVFLEYDNVPSLYSPFITKQQFLWSNFMKMNFDLDDFVCKNIDQGNYFYCQVDEFYIPNRISYQKTHFIHDFLIYGYNCDARQYYTAGYDNNYMYSKGVCTYEEFGEAFRHNTWDKQEAPWTDKIRLYHYNEQAHYSFNLELIKCSLSNYLSGENIFNQCSRFKEPYHSKVYGLDVYQSILEHIAVVRRNLDSEEKWEEIYLDNRIFRLLFEHKSIMMARMQYIDKTVPVKDFIEKYSEVKDLTEKSHLCAIKYKIAQNKKLLDKIEQHVIHIRELEETALRGLYERI